MTFVRLRLTGALVALLIVAAACSSTESTSAPGSASALAGASTGASGAAAESAGTSPEGRLTSAFDLEVGDCFNTEQLSSVDEVAVVDCASPHVYEVFGLAEYDAAPGDAFPGDEDLNRAANDACRPAFEDYVGVAYDESEDWYATFINPSEETWAEGDREILCVLHTRDETEITGSAEGSAR